MCTGECCDVCPPCPLKNDVFSFLKYAHEYAVNGLMPVKMKQKFHDDTVPCL